MRYSAAAAVLATTVLANTEAPVSTAYTTQLVTVTSCGPEVPDCPAESMTTAVQTSMVPMTTSTVYSTKVHTVTSCAPDVPDCPAHSTVYSTETVPAYTTVCPVEPTTTTGPWNNSTAVMPTGGHTTKMPGDNGDDGNNGDNTSMKPVCPSSSVTAITKSYTTVLTSVEYSTIAIPCPTEKPTDEGDNGNPCPGPNCPTGTMTPAPTGGMPGNQTCPGPNCPPVTGGAASFAGSAVFAALAGVAAFVLA